MEREDFSLVAGVWLIIMVAILTIFGLCKLSGAMFDRVPGTPTYQERRALDMCDRAKGTPVLEARGRAYKSCAINGHSDTRNIVK